jgi:hypothetical protein
MLDVSGFLLTAKKTVIMPKVVGTLRQRYPECREASKVFNSPHPKIALYGYNMSITLKVMYSV